MSVVLKAIKGHPSSCLALVGDAKSINYGELNEAIDKASIELKQVNVLGIALDNGIDWISWDLATIKTNTVCVPLPPFFTKEQIEHTVHNAGITHIVSSEGLKETGISSNQSLPSGTAKITFTSGTTGTPKGVCLSQEGMEQVTQSLASILDHKFADRHLSVMPMAVLLENIAGVYATLIAGRTIYAPSLKTIGFANPFQPDFSVLYDYLKEHKISSAILVPELLRGLMVQKPSLPKLQFLAVGGSIVSENLVLQARQMGLPVYEGYGLSECASVVSLNTPDHNKAGSAGELLPHIKLEVKDNEVIIKNPAFLGYIGQPHKGEFKTGDFGHVDSDGFLHIDGRKKNILITSHGRNISPEWVESYLLAQPEIFQAVVYGDAQPFLSALIVPATKEINLDITIERVNSLLPDYAHIKDYYIVPPFTLEEGTLTATGRPRREAIFKQYQNFINKEKDNELLRNVN